MYTRSCRLVLVLALITSVTLTLAARPIPPPRNFRHDHYAYAEFEQLLAKRASRAEVRRNLTDASGAPHEIVGKKQFLALVPHGVAPSKRALILLEHWPHALYKGLIDDVRVLACFDSRDCLVAYELF